MLKRLLVLSILPAMLISCGGEKGKEEKKEVEVLQVAQFLGKEAPMVEKELTIEGTVTHICAHGGKKLFIMGKDPEKTVKITAGEAITKFDKEMEGSDVVITGIVKELKVDEAYLAEWEADLGITDSTDVEAEEHEHEHEHDAEHKGGGHGDDFHHGDGLAKINAMRKKLEDSGKDHLSFYNIECNKIEVKEDKKN